MPRILLVEDNEENRDMLCRRLMRRGFEVIMADNGQEGIALAESGSPDLILMDLSLPILDGWEATRRLKGHAATRHIPVVALTAHALATDRQRAFEAGCDEFDTKPLNFERLLTKIETMLARRDASAAQAAGGTG